MRPASAPTTGSRLGGAVREARATPRHPSVRLAQSRSHRRCLSSRSGANAPGPGTGALAPSPRIHEQLGRPPHSAGRAAGPRPRRASAVKNMLLTSPSTERSEAPQRAEPAPSQSSLSHVSLRRFAARRSSAVVPPLFDYVLPVCFGEPLLASSSHRHSRSPPLSSAYRSTDAPGASSPQRQAPRGCGSPANHRVGERTLVLWSACLSHDATSGVSQGDTHGHQVLGSKCHCDPAPHGQRPRRRFVGVPVCVEASSNPQRTLPRRPHVSQEDVALPKRPTRAPPQAALSLSPPAPPGSPSEGADQGRGGGSGTEENGR
jgi:hypothetical protein